MIKKEELNLTQEWDKTFPKSDKADHSKVTFINHFEMSELLGNGDVMITISLEEK